MIHFVIVGILVLVSTALVYFGITSIDLFPPQASLQAIYIDDLFNVHWIVLSFFFSLIVVFILYSLVVFRRKAGEQGDGDHFEGNTPLEIVWTVVPLILVLGMAVLGAQVLGDVEARDPGAIEVNVYAKQWGWSFEYPEYGITTSELGLPVNRQVLLRMQSDGVIHSFWVPEFRVKQDVLPGGEQFIRELRITPNKEGTFVIRCAELCGTGHAEMRENVLVMSDAAYQAWIASQTCQFSEEACRGKDVAFDPSIGCVACHSQDGSEMLGPTWSGLFGSTVPLKGGGSVVVDEAFLRESILDPAAQLHEGFLGVMPITFGETLTEQQIEELIAFIVALGSE